MIYGAHNTLGLLHEILDEVKNAVEYLRKHDFVRFGTGVHIFQGFRVQF